MGRLSFFKTQLNAIVLSVGILFASQQSFAYYSPDLAWDLSIGAGYYLLSNEVIESSVKSEKASKKGTKKSAKSSSSKPAKQGVSPSAVSLSGDGAINQRADEFRYSAKISAQVTDEMMVLIENHLKASNANTVQAQKELKQLKNSQLIHKVRQALKSEGYNPNSLATAMTYWVVINYGIATNQDLSRLKGHALVAQLKNGIVTDMSLTSMSDDKKQRIADYLYWLASLKIALHTEAVHANNRQAINNSIQQAHQALHDIGLGVSMLSNGSDGVKIRL